MLYGCICDSWSKLIAINLVNLFFLQLKKRGLIRRSATGRQLQALCMFKIMMELSILLKENLVAQSGSVSWILKLALNNMKKIGSYIFFTKIILNVYVKSEIK